MTESLIARTLVRLLNRLLALDDNARQRLRPLQGRALGIELLGPNVRFVLSTANHRFCLSDPEQQEPQAWVRASPGSFVSLAAAQGRAPGAHLEISGDADTAQRFQEALKGLRPDWEEGFTQIFGDIAGVHLFRALTTGVDWVRNAGTALVRNTSEYLREESRQLITQVELDEFLDEVDDLRDDVARLEARYARLDAESR